MRTIPGCALPQIRRGAFFLVSVAWGLVQGFGAPTITQPPANATAADNLTASFAVTATGTGTLAYQWNFNGAPLYGANLAALSVLAQPGAAGAYSVTVSDSTGAVTSSPATLTVVPDGRSPAAPTLGFAQQFTDGGWLGVVGSPDGGPAVIEWFKDGQLLPGSTGNALNLNIAPSVAGAYLEVVGNAAGTFDYQGAEISTISTLPTSPWVAASAYNGVAYFAFASPAEILRYDMGAQVWLSPVTLPAAPTAMQAYAEGVYVALGSTSYLYSLDLSSTQTVASTSVSVTQIFANASFVYLFGGTADNLLRGSAVAINRSSHGSVAGTELGSYTDYGGIAVSSPNGLAYGWNLFQSGLGAFTLNADGTLAMNSSFPGGHAENGPGTPWVAASPDGSRLVLSTGQVLAAADGSFQSSLGLPLTDVCFLADNSAVGLRDGILTLYNASSLAAQGRVLLSGGSYQRVFADGGTVFAFAAPAAPGGPVGVASAAEAQFGTALPALPALSAAQSAAVGIAPDAVVVGTDGLAYLLVRPLGTILRWSPVSGYLSSIPLTGMPLGMTYSPELNCIYLFYGDRRVTEINLGSATAEVPYFTFWEDIDVLLACGDSLYAMTNNLLVSTTSSYLLNAAGAPTARQDISPDYDPSWNDPLGEIFFDAAATLFVLPTAGGSFGSGPSVAATQAKEPMRFSPDGTMLVDAAGNIYSSSSLAQTASLGAPLVDAAWIGTTVYALAAKGAAGSIVTIHGAPSYAATTSVDLAGVPLRIFALASGQLLVVTTQPTGALLTVLASTGAVVSQQAGTATPLEEPLITVEPVSATSAAGGNVTLSVAASGINLTYQWTNVLTGQVVGTAPTLSFPGISSAQDGVYQVQVAGTGGTVNSLPATVEVMAPPVFTRQPTSVSLQGSGPYSLDAAVPPFPPATYQWYFDGVPIPNATSPSFSFLAQLTGNAGTYTCVATNQFGSTTSNPAIVTITSPPQPPQFTQQPTSATANAGGTVLFAVAAVGTPAPAYQWYFNGNAIAGATSASLTLAGVTSAQAGTYYATATNAGGTVESSAVTLTVSATAATVITVPPQSQSVAVGASATFVVTATGSGTLTYQWDFNGVAIAGATGASYSLAGAQVANSGNYTVEVTGTGGSADAGAVLAVTAGGAPAIETQPQSQTIQAGSTVSFAVRPTGAETDAALTFRTASTPTYQWYHNGVAVAAATDPTVVVAAASYAAAGTYTCLLVNAAGATLSNAATLLVVQSGSPGRLVDVSCRAHVGTGGDVLITGFVVGGEGGSGVLPVLVRSSGPALASLGVQGALADPALGLFDATPGSAALVTDAGWKGSANLIAAAAAVGAFPWTNKSSLDSALQESLPAGAFTAQTVGASGDTGVALAEIYDATPAGTFVAGRSQRLINLSARVQVTGGSGELIAGFVIGGDTAITVLIRASGPALTQFGVLGILPDPQLQVFQTTGGSSSLLATCSAWDGDAQITAVAATVGAFAWKDPGSLDAAVILTLPPGAYTANVSGESGDTGVALIEVYEVP